MSLVYRGAGAWGAGKGANLIASEFDNNTYELHLRIAALESTPPEPNNIADISVVDGQMTITMDDASTFGPFTIAVPRPRWRGDWAGSTLYAVNDWFRISEDSANDGVYFVLVSHTSAGAFDPDAVDGEDNPVYELAIPIDAAGGSVGGSLAGVVEKAVDEFTYSPALGDEGKLFRGLAPGDQAFIIPLDATVNFAIGTTFYVQAWYGLVEIYEENPTTDIYYPQGFYSRTRSWYSVLSVTKTAANEWVVSGDMEFSEPAVREWDNTAFTLNGFNRASRGPVVYNVDHASGCTITVPLNGGCEYGDTFIFRQHGSGQVTLSPAGSVTIYSIPGSTYKTIGQGSVMTLMCLGDNKWLLSGDVV